MRNEATILDEEDSQFTPEIETSNTNFDAPDFRDYEDTNDYFNDLVMIAEQNKPAIADDHESRFAVSMLFAIPIARRNAYNTFGNFKLKNAPDMNFIDRLYLIPLNTMAVNYPPETYGGDIIEGKDAESLLDQLSGDFLVPNDPRAEIGTGGAVFSRKTRTAKECASIFMQDFGGNNNPIFGASVLDSLQNQKYSNALKIYRAVLPYKDSDIFKLGDIRTVQGFDKCRPPYLVDILDFLQSPESRKYTNKLLSGTHIKIGDKLRQELLTLCIEAKNQAQSRINEKDDQILKGKAKNYDTPDYRHDDAPLPPDLVMLANLNMAPIQERQAEAANKNAKMIAESAASAASGGVVTKTENGKVKLTEEQLNAAKEHLLGDESFIEQISKQVLSNVGLGKEE